MKNVVTTQLMYKNVLCVNDLHYMVHHTNLVVQTLSELSSVTNIKSLFSFVYNYLLHSLKWHCEMTKLEITQLVELLKCKGNKILKNVKM
jgi:hypothetical protein